jgi:hypothetical protein
MIHCFWTVTVRWSNPWYAEIFVAEFGSYFSSEQAKRKTLSTFTDELFLCYARNGRWRKEHNVWKENVRCVNIFWGTSQVTLLLWVTCPDNQSIYPDVLSCSLVILFSTDYAFLLVSPYESNSKSWRLYFHWDKSWCLCSLPAIISHLHETPAIPSSRKPYLHQTGEEFQYGWRFTGYSSPNHEFHRRRIGKEKRQ